MTGHEGRGRLDEIIHPVTRLSICGLLATGPQWVEFSVVRDTVGVSDSVLSKQSRILEDVRNAAQLAADRAPAGGGDPES